MNFSFFVSPQFAEKMGEMMLRLSALPGHDKVQTLAILSQIQDAAKHDVLQ